jgi:hypothetical protein
MKKKLIESMVILFGVSSVLYANCENLPSGLMFEDAVKTKNIDKAETVLEKYKLNIKAYLKSCDKSEAMFEQMEISKLTYEDKLSDLKEDAKSQKVAKTRDCAILPSSTNLNTAIKSGDLKEVTKHYEAYKTNAESYLDLCASHEDYELVYDEALLHEENYNEWKKS